MYIYYIAHTKGPNKSSVERKKNLWLIDGILQTMTVYVWIVVYIPDH